MEESWHRLTLEEAKCCSGKAVVVDVETTGLLWWQHTLIGVGLWCPQADVQGYWPCEEPHERAGIIDALQHWAPGTNVIGHNLKFDLHFLGLDGHKLGWKAHDTTVLAHLLDSRQHKSLGAVELQYLGSASKEEHVAWGKGANGKGKRKLMVWEWPEDVRAEYCVNDCRVTYELARLLLPQVKATGCGALYDYQMRYLLRIWQIERYGMLFDMEFADRAIELLHRNVDIIEQELFKDCGAAGFNWRSPQQLSKALYEDLGIDKPQNPFVRDGVDLGGGRIKSKYTETATSTFMLMEKANHPLGQLVSDLREAWKLRNTVAKWKELADANSVIHTTFNLTGTRTGRLSSSKPNTQNLPGDIRSRETQSVFSGQSGSTRSEEYNLRKAFIPRPGHQYAIIDYRQQEIRMFGVLAQDPNMVEALRTGQDIHMQVAKTIWGDSADKTKREWAKTISFGRFMLGRSKTPPIAGNPTAGNQQPGRVGTSANGSETHSMTRSAMAGMPLAA